MPPDVTGKPTIRAERIHHHFRMRARTWAFARSRWIPPPSPTGHAQWRDRQGRLRFFRTWDDVNEYMLDEVRHRTENRASCSGICCGNPRHWLDERTRQEMQAAISAREQLEEIRDPRGQPERA
jgi:hypothetical protein